MSSRRVWAAAALLAGTMLASATATTAVAQVSPPPETTIDTGPSGTVTDPSATFTFSSNDPGATFDCSLDGQAYAPCTSPKDYADLADGVHHFDVRAVNAAGPDESPADRDWTVNRPDTTPPDTTITSGPAGTVEETSATFTFSASEGNVTFECSKDNGPYLACTSPKTYYGFADGPHGFRVRAIDGADNPDPSPAARDWTVRKATTTTQPPTTGTTAPPTTNTTTPPNNTDTTSPPSGGGGIFVSPAKPTTTTGKPTTTTGKPAKGGGGNTSTSTTAATTETTVPAGPVADPPGALVLSGRSDSGDFTAAAPQGGGQVVGEVNKPHQRNTGFVIGFAAVLGLLLAATGGVLWWRRPGRYMPA